MNSKARPFLDFYETHEIIPTELIIDDENLFFNQRNLLFQSLGIPPYFLAGKEILEVGPGTGQKVKHLLSLKPRSYTAVENNPVSVNKTQKVLKETKTDVGCELIECNFLNYQSSRKFDFLIAELVIPTQTEPEKFIQKMIDLCNPGGLIIFTCMDPIGILPELLRRAIVLEEKLIGPDLINSAQKIVDFFKIDLDSLEGMSRIRTDWAIDQIIHPLVGNLLSISDAIKIMYPHGTFQGSNPRFVENYDWYKSKKISANKVNESADIEYWTKCHNLIDYRFTSRPRDVSFNKSMNKISNEIFAVTYLKKWNKNSHQQVLDKCRELQPFLAGCNQGTLESLSSFFDYWKTKDPKKLSYFRSWWGRTTNYISFVKN